MSIRHRMRAITVLACMFLGSVAAHAAATSYDAIYVFGDSYCDVGNDFAFTHGATPAAPYYKGRFSNGPIWIEHVAGAMGLPMNPSLLTGAGTDYAFGGAFVTIPGNDTTIPPNVPQQVELYLSLHGGKADPKALYVIEGGGNDILDANPSTVTPSYLGYQIALGLSESELLLRRAGARYFLIPNLLDVGQLPGAAADPSFATAATVATNNALNLFLGFEDFIEGIYIRRVDAFSLFHNIATDPTHFGFTDITTPCLSGTVVCAHPDHTLFWDLEHPTEFGHSFFAVAVESSLGN
jgi:phospholipase/lecithinase/hemolysin